MTNMRELIEKLRALEQMSANAVKTMADTKELLSQPSGGTVNQKSDNARITSSLNALSSQLAAISRALQDTTVFAELASRYSWEATRESARMDDVSIEEVRRYVLEVYPRLCAHRKSRHGEHAWHCHKILYRAMQPSLGYSSPGGTFQRQLITWIYNFNIGRPFLQPTYRDEEYAFSFVAVAFSENLRKYREAQIHFSTDDLLEERLCVLIEVQDEETECWLYQTERNIFCRPCKSDSLRDSIAPAIKLLRDNKERLNAQFLPFLELPDTDESGNSYRAFARVRRNGRLSLKCLASGDDGIRTSTGRYIDGGWVIRE